VRLLLCILCLLAAMFLASCGKKPELLQPLTMPPPVFTSPADPKAVVALTEDEARAFRAWSAEMKLWRDAVLAWWTSLQVP
jgi:hypothetical protein